MRKEKVLMAGLEAAFGLILISMAFFCAACTPTSPWQHPFGFDKERFRKDVKECKGYARDMTNVQKKTLKFPATSPHGGVMEAFMVYGMFSEFFESCMKEKGWTKLEDS